jgi:hypothetical protein
MVYPFDALLGTITSDKWARGGPAAVAAGG